MKLGLFGGTFDPIHNGHLQLAELAMSFAGLDSIIFVPAKEPPHKNQPLGEYVHRVAMVKQTVAENPQFSCSTIEGERQGPSYTLPTIQYFISELPDGDELYFICGLDTFLEIESWYNYRELFGLTNFLITGRQGYNQTRLSGLLKKLGYQKSGEGIWGNRSEKQVLCLQNIPVGVSSTAIRSAIAGQEQFEQFLPANVKNYILENNLYS